MDAPNEAFAIVANIDNRINTVFIWYVLLERVVTII